MIHIVIPGPPIGKGRPKFARGKNFVRVYSPAKTTRMEELIKLVFCGKYPGHVPLAGPLEVGVMAYFAIPASTPKKLAALMATERVPYCHKPDADNVLKILDALNGICWKDDSLICRAIVGKYYSERPRLEIDVSLFFEQSVSPATDDQKPLNSPL